MSLKKYLVNARTKILEFKKKHNFLVEKVLEVEEEIPEKIIITLENTSGTLTEQQLNDVKTKDVVIKYDNKFFYKGYQYTDTYIDFTGFQLNDNPSGTLAFKGFRITLSNGSYMFGNYNSSTFSAGTQLYNHLIIFTNGGKDYYMNIFSNNGTAQTTKHSMNVLGGIIADDNDYHVFLGALFRPSGAKISFYNVSTSQIVHLDVSSYNSASVSILQ